MSEKHGRIIEKAHGGREQESIWEVSDNLSSLALGRESGARPWAQVRLENPESRHRLTLRTGRIGNGRAFEEPHRAIRTN